MGEGAGWGWGWGSGSLRRGLEGGSGEWRRLWPSRPRSRLCPPRAAAGPRCRLARALFGRAPVSPRRPRGGCERGRPAVAKVFPSRPLGEGGCRGLRPGGHRAGRALSDPLMGGD